MSHVDRRIDSVEQRLAGDVPLLCDDLASLAQDLLLAASDAAFYTYSMCSYAHPKYAMGIGVRRGEGGVRESGRHTLMHTSTLAPSGSYRPPIPSPSLLCAVPAHPLCPSSPPLLLPQGYVAAAAVVITALSPPFGKLLGKQQQLSGEYRALHSRVRAQSESIAFYGGHSKEASLVGQAFSALTRHTAGER